MIKLISRKDILADYPVMPWITYDSKNDEEIVHMPSGAAFMVVGTSKKTFAANVNTIWTEIKLLFKDLGFSETLIMGAQDMPWRLPQGSYTDIRVAKAMKFFEDSGIGPKFNGAVSIPLTDFGTWFKHVSQMVSVNALIQDMYFMDVNQSFYFSPCQYGNLHLTVMSKSLVKKFRTAILEGELILISAKACGLPGLSANRQSNKTSLK